MKSVSIQRWTKYLSWEVHDCMFTTGNVCLGALVFGLFKSSRLSFTVTLCACNDVFGIDCG